MSQRSRWLLLIGQIAVSIMAGEKHVQAQADTDPARYEIGLEYARLDPWVYFKRFRHAMFISGRIPYNDRLVARSELSLVFTEDFAGNDEMRFGSVFIGGEFTSEASIVQLGVRLPVESNPDLNMFYLPDPGVDDRRLAVFRPGVGSVVAHLSRSPYEEGTVGIVGGVGTVFLFGDLYEVENRTWIRTDIEFILRGTRMTASLGLSSVLPMPILARRFDLNEWRFQPRGSLRFNNDMVSPGVFVRHPNSGYSNGWVVGADVRILFF